MNIPRIVFMPAALLRPADSGVRPPWSSPVGIVRDPRIQARRAQLGLRALRPSMFPKPTQRKAVP